MLMFKHKIWHREQSKTHEKNINITAWKVSKYGVFSGPYLPVSGLNTEIYGVDLRIQSETGKYRPEKTPHLDTFYAMHIWLHVYEYEYFFIII